jgi:hypothetical protein
MMPGGSQATQNKKPSVHRWPQAKKYEQARTGKLPEPDYQRLAAEGKLREAGQKLEELKRAFDKLNTRKK